MHSQRTRGSFRATAENTRGSKGHNEVRRGSVQPCGSALERPRLQARTHSAPLVEGRAADGNSSSEDEDEDGSVVDDLTEEEARNFAQAGVGALELGQDEEEVVGVVGAVRNFHPFVSPEASRDIIKSKSQQNWPLISSSSLAQVSEPVAQEVNIAVIGAQGVGKSTFVQRALGLPYLPASRAAESTIPVEGSVYLVRLLELPIDDVVIDDDDNTVSWPDTIENKVMPDVDGALFLYDVGDEDSLKYIPEMLKATNKAALPSLLVSCKCDTPASKREVDPVDIEQKARRSITGLSTLQTSEGSGESHKRAVSMIIKSIIFGSPDYEARYSSAPRARAHSNAVRPVSPRPPQFRSHSRASSEYTGSLNLDKKHSRRDSSLAAYGSSDRLRVPRDVLQDGMNGTFLLEESASEGEQGSNRSSTSGELNIRHLLGNAPSTTVLSENGTSFDKLVDRLLAQPTSKADSKFAAVFLALYRNFAAPGRLLEAIVERFEGLERKAGAQMIKTVSQLRHLSIVDQWVGTYPGDFAFPKTKRRMRTFIGKISQSRIFSAAAREMTMHLDSVQEDDDTHWARTDEDREADADYRASVSSTSSTLIDDLSFVFVEDVNGKLVGTDMGLNLTAFGEKIPSASFPSPSSTTTVTSFSHNFTVDAAQKQAALFQAIPCQPLIKLHWHVLMEKPDDLIARELTRMDWIMFSSIRPRDLVRDVSLSPLEKAKCKNLVHIDRMTSHFNQLAAWAANFILLRDKPKHRALMLEKIMRVARKLRELNNYNALGALIAGIKSSAVHRLAATRELIPPDVGRDWLKLDILMAPSKSHFAYRLAWENSTSERVPYLPLHRRDLVSAQEGNKTFIGEERGQREKGVQRINWKKFEIMGEVIVSLQRAQGMPYKEFFAGTDTKGDAVVRELVLDLRLERDEELLYERSTQCEPPPSNSGVANASAKFREFFKR